MPRFLANIICKLTINDIYRPYIYSWVGLKRLVTKAGFRNVEVSSSLPSYNEPEHTIKLSSKSNRFEEYIWKTENKLSLQLKKMLVKFDLLKYFGYAFRVVAFKQRGFL